MQVRKKRFLHFYAFAIALATAVFVLELTVYVLEIPVPSWIVELLDFCGTRKRYAILVMFGKRGTAILPILI